MYAQGQVLKMLPCVSSGCTPADAAMTPMHCAPVPAFLEEQAAAAKGEDAIAAAVTAAVKLEELQSVKEEQAAEDTSLFPLEVVPSGVVQIGS